MTTLDPNRLRPFNDAPDRYRHMDASVAAIATPDPAWPVPASDTEALALYVLGRLSASYDAEAAARRVLANAQPGGEPHACSHPAADTSPPTVGSPAAAPPRDPAGFFSPERPGFYADIVAVPGGFGSGVRLLVEAAVEEMAARDAGALG